MYDDRLEILSSGRLSNTITFDNMRETRCSRGPRIARILEDRISREVLSGLALDEQVMQLSFPSLFGKDGHIDYKRFANHYQNSSSSLKTV